jgi:soluble lytic murein transglycosylase
LNSILIYGLIRRESMFDEAARSPSGALGLMQIMPETGRQIK